MKDLRRKGQVTLLAVILGVLGLTLGLSVASRSLSDLRQATTVDVGTKALAAAEAGAEYALAKLAVASDPEDAVTDSQEIEDELDFDESLGLDSLTYSITPGPSGYAQSKSIQKDDVYQVSFPEGSTGLANMGIYWSGAPGIEVVAVYANDFRVNRFAYRATSDPTLNNSDFEGVGVGTPPAGCGDGTFPTIKGFTGANTIQPNVVGDQIVLLRIKPVAGSGQFLVCGGNIPSQYYEVVARAETDNGTVRRVRVTRDISGVLPGIFDNVLYSGGDIIKD